MSEKLNVKLPEVATALLKLKQRTEDEKNAEERRRVEERLKDYAYVLGWYTTEDGPIDIERCGKGLIALVVEYKKISKHIQHATESGRYDENGEYNGLGKLNKPTMRARGFSDDEIEKMEKISIAYDLLDDTFTDFNDYVAEIWKEFGGDRRSAFRVEVAKWEKEKEIFENVLKEETDQLIKESVEAELAAKNEARLAEGKKRVGVLKWEERYPVESAIRERQSEKKFGTPKPVFTKNPEHSRMKAQKLNLEELEREVGKLEN